MIPPLGATPEGTRKFFKNRKKECHPDKVRKLQDWQVSALAMGSYLGNYDDKTDALYEESVKEAVKKGCNFFDTAINYRCQRSERAFGRVLNELMEAKKIKRNQFVISTKGGFIPFDSKPVTNMAAYIQKNWIDRGIVKEEDIVSSCHCMHPKYLQTQIDQSLTNLRLDTIDLYYLHNPETQLPVAGKDLFFDRLRKAFELFEDNVARGKIQSYGLATWTAFREPREAVEYIPLNRVVELAEEAGGKDHHLRALQLPYNMAMLEAISVANQTLEGKDFPIFPAASAYGLSVMTSAPLLQSQLLNLPPTLTRKFPDSLTLAQKAIQFVISTPGITSAMVGMKEKKHVEEDLEVLSSANWDLSALQKVCDLLVNR